MKPISSRTALALVGAALALAASEAAAQNLQHDRGTILNLDMRARQVQIKDAKDRERIWPFAADATVKFSDQAWQNRSATLRDLKVGMYVHFRYSSGDNEVIQEFDVKDIGKGGSSGSGSGGTLGGSVGGGQVPAGMQSGRVTAVDLNVAQVEVMLDGAGRKTFQAANARVLAGVKAGDRIALRTQREANGQDIVIEVQPMRR
jgi:hypothetical protein